MVVHSVDEARAQVRNQAACGYNIIAHRAGFELSDSAAVTTSYAAQCKTAKLHYRPKSAHAKRQLTKEICNEKSEVPLAWMLDTAPAPTAK